LQLLVGLAVLDADALLLAVLEAVALAVALALLDALGVALSVASGIAMRVGRPPPPLGEGEAEEELLAVAEAVAEAVALAEELAFGVLLALAGAVEAGAVLGHGEEDVPAEGVGEAAAVTVKQPVQAELAEPSVRVAVTS
jgi:hypothetical protein